MLVWSLLWVFKAPVFSSTSRLDSPPAGCFYSLAMRIILSLHLSTGSICVHRVLYLYGFDMS